MSASKAPFCFFSENGFPTKSLKLSISGFVFFWVTAFYHKIIRFPPVGAGFEHFCTFPGSLVTFTVNGNFGFLGIVSIAPSFVRRSRCRLLCYLWEEKRYAIIVEIIGAGCLPRHRTLHSFLPPISPATSKRKLSRSREANLHRCFLLYLFSTDLGSLSERPPPPTDSQQAPL